MERKKQLDNMNTSGFSAQELQNFLSGKTNIQTINAPAVKAMTTVPVNRTNNQSNHTTINQTNHITTTDANAASKIGTATKQAVQHTRRASLGNTDVEVAP